MTTKGADPEALTALVTHLCTSAGQLECIHQSLRSSLQTVGWGGWDADSFRNEWDGVHAATFQRAVEALRSAATTLNANAAAQRETSAAEAASKAGDGSSGGGSRPSAVETLQSLTAVTAGGAAIWANLRPIERVVSLAQHRTLVRDASRWKFGGYYDRHLTEATGGLLSGGASLGELIWGESTITSGVKLGGDWAGWASAAMKLPKPPTGFGAALGWTGVVLGAAEIATDTKWNKLGSDPREDWKLARRTTGTLGDALLLVPEPHVQAVGLGLKGVSLVIQTGEWVYDNRAQIEHTVSAGWKAAEDTWQHGLSWLEGKK